MALTAYADADHAGCQDTQRSTPGSAQFLRDKLVSWSSKKYKSTMISTTEAEYIAMSGCYTMVTLNIPANDAPAEQAPAIAPLTGTDDQILPAFTASSTILPIYIQQFLDTMCFNSSTGLYNCQLDEKWFNLHKNLLRVALNITPTNDNNPFVAPPSSDTFIKYVNTLGYPYTLRNVSAMSVNALYQPWRAVLSIINMFLTSKTVGYDRPRHLVLQILWGIIHHSNINYAERIWEEFVQSIQTFLTDRKNLTTASRGKKKTAHLLIPGVRFTELIIHHLKTKHNIHPRTGLPLHYSHDENVLNTLRFVGKDGRAIFGAPYYDEYLEHVAKYQQHLDAEHGMEDEGGATESPKATKVAKPKATKETSDAPSPAKRAKAGKVTKQRMPKSSLQLVNEFVDEGVPEKEPAHDDEEADLQRALELSLKDQGMYKEREKRKSLMNKRTPMLTESSGHAESPSLDAELALTDSEMEYDEEAPEIHARDQDESQAGPNPGEKDEGQARPNPGEQDEGEAEPNPVEQEEGQAG
ncbi:retrovirus-related pol polyprotein from transposon TNT 1-94 [Tanacetum coccineum]